MPRNVGMPLSRSQIGSPTEVGSSGHSAYPADAYAIRSSPPRPVEPSPHLQAGCRLRRFDHSRHSRRHADHRLLYLRFAIIIAPGTLRPCRGEIMCGSGDGLRDALVTAAARSQLSPQLHAGGPCAKISAFPAEEPVFRETRLLSF
jgi:hypothetical protein